MNKEKLREILAQPFNYEDWKLIFKEIFADKVNYFTQIHPLDAKEVKSGGQVGTIRLDDGRSLAIFVLEVTDNVQINRNRKKLRNIAIKPIDQSLIHGSWVLYYSKRHNENYRLTYVTKQTSFSENGELLQKETDPKRYTFLLGKNERCTTASDRLYELKTKRQEGSIYLADITEAFSVERLNKEFFKGYKEQYEKFLKYITDTKQHRDYVKKLLGRLVFLQFLQKKGWMGVPASNSNWEGGDKDYLLNLIKRYKGNNSLLSDVLEPLFFNTLNEPREKDIADSRLGENIKIPYLNGGLFDKDQTDELNIDFPYDYFKDLLEFFAAYNFTIDENDPDDSEVGIDPEMLGHIFENLLEDNKDKGAFYTPKEIVQYMCRQSVIQYLKTHEPDGKYTEAIEDLINKNIVQPILQEKTVAIRFIQLLKDVKVCDPAIGSGAFPMGILYVLYHAHHHLQSHAEPHASFDSTKVKRDIIQNNIFGVDIEQGAVDIARLRFWLALVVDAEEPQPLPNLDYKITCGDSLLNRYAIDAPIEQVFVEYNKDKKEEEQISLAQYQQLVKEYTNTSNHQTKDVFRQTIEAIKSAFKVELDKQLIKDLSRTKGHIASLEAPLLFGERSKKDKDELKKHKQHLAELKQQQENILSNKLYQNSFEWRFEFPTLLSEDGTFKGFDIVIGNPPYLRIQGIRKTNEAFADELTKKYRSATGAFDLYALFAERGLQIINKQGLVNYIMPAKWTNAAFGVGLREVVAQQKAASKIINFGAYQVFNASTYTALQWFKPNSDTLEYHELNRDLTTNQELGQYLNTLTSSYVSTIKAEKLDKSAWVLTTSNTAAILELLEKHPQCIGDIFDRIFCGLQTSKDDVYFIYDCEETPTCIFGFSKELNACVQIERGLVKPLLKGEDVHRYDNIQTDRFVIFPYKIQDGKAVLYSEKELATLFPMGYTYLKECEDVLRNRERGKLLHDEYWYRYIYPKNLVLFDNEKLVAPEISLGGNFAYDKAGEFYATTKIYGYIKKAEIKESYKFWLALFNSRLFWFYLQNTGYVLRGGYFTFKTNYITPFPVPDSQQISKGEKLVNQLIDFLLYLYDKNNADILAHTNNKRLATHIEEIIDMIVYELYFEEHVKTNQIDVIHDLYLYSWSHSCNASAIEAFYNWYQQSDNSVRQKLMLLDTRSKDFIYQIHTTGIR